MKDAPGRRPVHRRLAGDLAAETLFYPPYSPVMGHFRGGGITGGCDYAVVATPRLRFSLGGELGLGLFWPGSVGVSPTLGTATLHGDFTRALALEVRVGGGLALLPVMPFGSLFASASVVLWHRVAVGIGV
jgi:hypothetical protein